MGVTPPPYRFYVERVGVASESPWRLIRTPGLHHCLVLRMSGDDRTTGVYARGKSDGCPSIALPVALPMDGPGVGCRFR